MVLYLMKRHSSRITELMFLGGIVIAGDTAVQLLDNAYKKDTIHQILTLDLKRTLGSAATGFLWDAPLSMAWFPFLHKFMQTKMSHVVEGSFRYVATKVMMENVFLAAPICLGFFVIPALVERGHLLDSLPSRLQEDFLPSLSTDISFWCMVSPFNYKFVPIRYQATVSCTLGGIEAAGLSHISHIENFEWPSLSDIAIFSLIFGDNTEKSDK
jgi:hypothetical protein